MRTFREFLSEAKRSVPDLMKSHGFKKNGHNWEGGQMAPEELHGHLSNMGFKKLTHYDGSDKPLSPDHNDKWGHTWDRGNERVTHNRVTRSKLGADGKLSREVDHIDRISHLPSFHIKSSPAHAPSNPNINHISHMHGAGEINMHKTFQKHGWSREAVGIGEAIYVHPKHQSHAIFYHPDPDGPNDRHSWTHWENENSDEPMAQGTRHNSLDRHLTKFHGAK